MAGGAGANDGVSANPWLMNESEETRGLTFGEIKQQQQRIIEGKLGSCDNHLSGVPHHTSLTFEFVRLAQIQASTTIVPIWNHSRHCNTNTVQYRAISSKR